MEILRESEPISVFCIAFILRFKLVHDFPGFPINAFCIPERYAPYLDKVLVSNGMIKDR